jgi:hypothetical protein
VVDCVGFDRHDQPIVIEIDAWDGWPSQIEVAHPNGCIDDIVAVSAGKDMLRTLLRFHKKAPTWITTAVPTESHR